MECPQKRSWPSELIPEASGLLGLQGRGLGYAGSLEQTLPALHIHQAKHTDVPCKASKSPGDTEDSSQEGEPLSDLPLWMSNPFELRPPTAELLLLTHPRGCCEWPRLQTSRGTVDETHLQRTRGEWGCEVWRSLSLAAGEAGGVPSKTPR